MRAAPFKLVGNILHISYFLFFYVEDLLGTWRAINCKVLYWVGSTTVHVKRWGCKLWREVGFSNLSTKRCLDEIGSPYAIELLHITLSLFEFLTDYLLQVISHMVQVMLISLIVVGIPFLSVLKQSFEYACPERAWILFRLFSLIVDTYRDWASSPSLWIVYSFILSRLVTIQFSKSVDSFLNLDSFG